MDAIFKDYVKARDEAVTESIKKDSVEPFKEFLIKSSNCKTTPPDKVLEISIRKVAIHSIGVEPLYKGLAVNWLLEHGYNLDLN